MKIKLKELRRKCQPWVDNMYHRLHHQEMLLTELARRQGWRLRVIEACDNFKEIFKTGVHVYLDRIIFPSHRRINPRIGTCGYLVHPDRNKYHIIRQGKRKWRIVKAKSKKDKKAVSNIPVDADKVRCGDIVKTLDNSLVQIHHIDEHGEVHYIAFADKYYGEMQRAPYRCTYGYITQIYTATIKEKTWLRKWIKQCKAGKIGHRI